MKEKIQFLSKGIFEYEDPEIRLSADRLDLDIAYGEIADCGLEVTSTGGREIRAMVFSTHQRLRVSESMIVGERAQIRCRFDARGMEAGEQLDCEICLVSNGGEIHIPVSVRIRPADCETSLGRISDLDAFALLARDNWQEALGLFKSEQFPAVFLTLRKNRQIYESLIKGGDADQAMEEFLCMTRRKQPVRIHVAQEMIELNNPDSIIREKLVIEKNQWGRLRLGVRCEGNFITILRKTVTEEDFLGSYYQLEYTIAPIQGRSRVGAIILETAQGEIRIPVTVISRPARREADRERRSIEQAWTSLYRKFLALKMGRISRYKWMSQCREDVNCLLNNSSDIIYRVVEAHYLCECGDHQAAAALLEQINGRELRYRSAIYYSYYLYVTAICKEDEHYTSLALDTIRFYAQGQYQESWELLLMLIRLDKRSFGSPARLFRRMKEIFKSHIPGSLFYLEAVRMINVAPELVREMGSFETGLLMWGMRHDCLSEGSISHFAEMILRMPVVSRSMMTVMQRLYESSQAKEALAAVVHHMILGKIADPESHIWYQRGIEASLRLPELYEYFMKTLDQETCTSLPASVLIYFQYDNHLPAQSKAFLYRYVLEHRDSQRRLFDSYDAIIKTFAFEQLFGGMIDRNLAIIYQYYLAKPELLTPHVVRALPYVMFKKQIHTEQPGVRGVVVDYSDLTRELYYPLDAAGNAYVDIFMDDYRILFKTESGARRMADIPYEMTDLLRAGSYIHACEELCREHLFVLMNRSERALKYQMMDDASVDIYSRALRMDGVSPHYQKTILRSLIDYYYDNYEGDTLEKYLVRLDIRLLGHRERIQIIEFYIQRGLFEKAYEAIRTYGCDGMMEKRIMRLSSRLIREKGFKEDPLLTELAWQAFEGGRYDENILKYLGSHYQGPTEQLYALWKASGEFEVPADELTERLLCQILFAGALREKGGEVFAAYYRGHASGRIIRAFLADSAYRYLHDDAAVTEETFNLMEIELDQLEAVREVCALALLKHYAAGTGRGSRDYSKWIEREAAAFLEKDMILPFFASFSGLEGMPSALLDTTCIEYHARPGHKALISYRMNDQQEFVRESMQCILGGIFVKNFRLFNGDRLEYSITDVCGDMAETVRSEVIDYRRDDSSREDGIAVVNRLLDAQDFHDEAEMDRLIGGYDRLDRFADEIMRSR